eukprot:gnl/MRDRNA2_/MRDRNA2_59091_c0_seq1.p1 gnl/MRDRNA2_/MRDRNA2_59091_c0~~gnl/MRDRNA2_/MRDRNA2_59091_c0_seq1.p1  ORF type:complete len:302 (-),score=58.65 gnl/MRDRNA2_/MRDRNA2_59091_c0_seq1:310-1215(-)
MGILHMMFDFLVIIQLLCVQSYGRELAELPTADAQVSTDRLVDMLINKASKSSFSGSDLDATMFAKPIQSMSSSRTMPLNSYGMRATPVQMSPKRFGHLTFPMGSQSSMQPPIFQNQRRVELMANAIRNVERAVLRADTLASDAKTIELKKPLGMTLEAMKGLGKAATGAKVVDVAADSNAAKENVMKDSVLISINGKPVYDTPFQNVMDTLKNLDAEVPIKIEIQSAEAAAAMIAEKKRLRQEAEMMKREAMNAEANPGKYANTSYGLGTNNMDSSQKELLIYGSLVAFFGLFIAGYGLN